CGVSGRRSEQINCPSRNAEQSAKKNDWILTTQKDPSEINDVSYPVPSNWDRFLFEDRQRCIRAKHSGLAKPRHCRVFLAAAPMPPNYPIKIARKVPFFFEIETSPRPPDGNVTTNNQRRNAKFRLFKKNCPLESAAYDIRHISRESG